MRRTSDNLGGIGTDDYEGSLSRAAVALGRSPFPPRFRSVTPAMIAEAQELGLPAVLWTVNIADMQRLMYFGVDGIITDYPTRLPTVIEECGLRLPKAWKYDNRGGHSVAAPVCARS